MTYILRGMRAFSMMGWDLGEIGIGLAAVTGIGALTLTMAFRALRGRVQ